MKHTILFLSILFAVQIGTAQDTWNACNSTVTVIPAPSYDSTFVLEAPSRAALQKGMANWVPASSGGGASYLVYTALLTQTGTSAPVATVLENTLGVTITWGYFASGWYTATASSSVFTISKTISPYNLLAQTSNDSQMITWVTRTSSTVLNVRVSQNLTDPTDGIDDAMGGILFEIRVYN